MKPILIGSIDSGGGKGIVFSVKPRRLVSLTKKGLVFDVDMRKHFWSRGLRREDVGEFLKDNPDFKFTKKGRCLRGAGISRNGNRATLEYWIVPNYIPYNYEEEKAFHPTRDGITIKREHVLQAIKNLCKCYKELQKHEDDVVFYDD